MLKKTQAYQGFTLVELVIVVILLGVLAAIAVPRFFNVTDKARTAVVKSTGGAFSAALSVARAQWELNRETGEYIDLNGDGRSQTKFNQRGFPVGISADGIHPLSEIADGGVSGNDSCSQIFHNLVRTSGLSVVPADGQGKCEGGDFCATANGKNSCAYTFQKTKEKIIYDADTGDVVYPSGS